MPDADAGTTPGSGRKILVVDDDASVRRLITTILERAGYVPVPVATVAQARAYSAESVDLIVSDLHLADGNGLELLAKLLAEPGFERATKFLMISGDGDPTVAADIEAVGGTFLSKPFTAEELLQAIDVALGLLRKRGTCPSR